MILIGGNAIRVVPHWDDMTIRRENGQIRSAELRYNILGTHGRWLEAADADTALDRLSDATVLGNLYRVDSSIERIDNSAFEGTVYYEFKNMVDYTISFDTTGGTMQTKQSYRTVGAFAAPGFEPTNYHGAIGVQDGNVTGCEVVVPSLQFSIAQSRQGVIDLRFIRLLSTLTGRINSQPFLVFNIGDVLFEGANGAQNFSSEDRPTFDLTLKFRIQPSIYNLQAGGIDVGYKRGWDYFWVEHRKVFDYDCVSKSLEPQAAYIEQVYEEADLNKLLEDFIADE